MSYNDLRQSIAKVKIYFQEIKKTVIEENEKTLESDLVSLKVLMFPIFHSTTGINYITLNLRVKSYNQWHIY